jgi:hypothetical protein
VEDRTVPELDLTIVVPIDGFELEDVVGEGFGEDVASDRVVVGLILVCEIAVEREDDKLETGKVFEVPDDEEDGLYIDGLALDDDTLATDVSLVSGLEAVVSEDDEGGDDMLEASTGSPRNMLIL